jgi:hypothetical protein
MRRQLQAALRLTVIIALATAAVSCTALRYRAIQDDFNHAVEMDNESAMGRYGSSQVFVDPGYDEVISNLSDRYIAALDPKLQPNAYMLRAVSEWRLARSQISYDAASPYLDASLRSARAGLKDPGPQLHSRDHVILRILPALLIDTEIEKRFNDLDRKLSAAQYEQTPGFKSLFDQAFRQVQAGKNAIGLATPEGVRYYVIFQRWRLMDNWRTVINGLFAEPGAVPNTDDLRDKASIEAAGLLAVKSLDAEMREIQKSIPADDPIRKLMDALSTR